ncbi:MULTISPECIES: hypothetical protein [Lysinibacillus]|uniref:DUF2157 domain-containing protein n=1 Tax=Lysinibacillus antri TaxID=2498145 RepID=A0A3S0RY63_9BACI|nr:MULTISPECIES: hypothetical protein [Lysinibacillus]RUL57032.1 hypothetical protein EK386_01025 [Lysinibacillus antri]TSI03335.1 hypothetical protein FJQ64_17695 [Lysinibacillus sp. BW-2-10]
MQNPRKKIILNEILFWKQNKLLPEQYCDFLMTLYSEGNEIESEEEISHKKAVKAKEKRNNILLITSLSLVAVVLIVLLFLMTEAVWIMALITGVVACALTVGAFIIAKKNALLAPILQVLSALLIFGLSVKVSLTYFADNLLVLYSLLIANCLMWLITGLKIKLMYFTISGVIGLVILIGYQIIIWT